MAKKQSNVEAMKADAEAINVMSRKGKDDIDAARAEQATRAKEAFVRSDAARNSAAMDMSKVIALDEWNTRHEAVPSEGASEDEKEAWATLLESLATHGQERPVDVRETTGGKYELVSGFRRYHAAKHLGWTHIYVRVVRPLNNFEALAANIRENTARRELSAADQATGVVKLRKAAKDEGLKVSVANIAAATSISVSHAYNLLAIMDKLIPEYKKGFLQGHVKFDEARRLAILEKEDQLARYTEDSGAVEAGEKGGKGDPSKPKPINAAGISQLRADLPTAVSIRIRGGDEIKVNDAMRTAFAAMLSYCANTKNKKNPFVYEDKK
jgi:ParB/RepB/Spo0J family partition protein